MSWVTFIEDDFNTYPKEGYNVLISDGEHYDVAYYLMSSTYEWRKVSVKDDDANKFEDFIPIKWKYID